MQFNHTWLTSWVDTPLSPDALGERFTMAGLELEELRTLAPAFSHVVVGQVLGKSKHPDADRLNVCTVDVGEAAPRQIVCGASNVLEGMKVPCALPGAQLPGGVNIGVGRMRGVESAGMLCSGTELGIASEVDGLLVLPQEAPVGQCVRALLGLDESVYVFKVTPNRADCLSIQGLARELHALTGAPLLHPQTHVLPTPVPATIPDTLAVDIQDPKVCGRFVGRVLRGVNNQVPTPAWMRRRLEAAGQRSINALVDISNYVMLECGQPSHCFDLATLQGPLVVRQAQAGERITVLNGQELVLDPSVAVIADAQGPQAVAGIMGGQASAVQPHTQDVFLEAAFWWPQAIAGRARALNVGSEAAFRFERGVDFAATEAAVERITALVLSICGGKVGPVQTQTFELPKRDPVRLRHARAEQLVGMRFTAEQVEGVLTRLGCGLRREDDAKKFGAEAGEGGATYWVTPPSHRFDLSIEEDLVEELIRVVGYDQLPLRAPTGALKLLPVSETQNPWHGMRQSLAGLGYQEVLTYSFTPEAWEHELQGNAQPIRLQNPIASHLNAMRSGLVGSLLQVLRHNLAHRVDRLRVFELATTFALDNAIQDGPQTVAGIAQTRKIAGLAYGLAQSLQWGEPKRRTVDFFDVKGDLETLVHGLLGGSTALQNPLTWAVGSHPALHPGRCATLAWQGQSLGVVGELHPRWVQAWQLPQAPIVFELSAELLRVRTLPLFQEVSKQPSVVRDLAFVVDRNVPAQQLKNSVLLACQPFMNILKSVILFDEFVPEEGATKEAKGLNSNEKSLCFRLVFQDHASSLTELDVEPVVQQVLAQAAASCGARLRLFSTNAG